MVLQLQDFPSADAYVDAVKALPEAPAHADDPIAKAEHEAVLALVPRTMATHIAIRSGSWSKSNTWYKGAMPGTNAKVLVPEGVNVEYDRRGSSVPVFTVRIDGSFTWSKTKDTTLGVHTFVSSKTGAVICPLSTHKHLVDFPVGTLDPIWDPLLISKGMILHGRTSIIGNNSRVSWLRCLSNPLKGQDTLLLGAPPTGWLIGDGVIIGSTEFIPWETTGPQTLHTEYRTIKAISGNKVTLNAPLTYDHTPPAGPWVRDDFKCVVANLSRNFVLRSLGSAIGERAHFMQMHNPDYALENIQFVNMGRTDKSQRAVEAVDRGTGKNVKGRYAAHLHHTGVAKGTQTGSFKGNTIVSSPGWGFAAHEAKCDAIGNVVFNCAGAGMVSEAGNELGRWQGNCVMICQATYSGANGGDWVVKNDSDIDAFDLGRSGVGMWFQGRLIEVEDNVLVDCNQGYVYMHRSPGTAFTPDIIRDDIEGLFPPHLFFDRYYIRQQHIPIRVFKNNEAIATGHPFIILKDNGEQFHDMRSLFENFKAWECSTGINVTYTGHYTFIKPDLTGSDKYVGQRGYGDFGILIGKNANDMVIVGAKVRGFLYSVDLDHSTSVDGQFTDGRILIDCDLQGAKSGQYRELDTSKDLILTSAQLSPGRLILDSPMMTTPWNDGVLFFTGTKTDSVGPGPYPPNDERYPVDSLAFRGLLTVSGYYTDAAGLHYIKWPMYYSDRVTGSMNSKEFTITFPGDPNGSWLQGEGGVKNNGPLP